ncbi:MAG: ECF transporter S component [Defluviitaleaceae bacterium]|nr:ECF transporter S component [Defluviitaleaceae bacterium]
MSIDRVAFRSYTSSQNLVLASLFLCLCLILPFFVGNIPTFGAMLLPMHFPVLVCGIVLGPKYGGLVGLLAPFTRFFMIGMPPLLTAAAMTFELAAYGIAIGLLYHFLPKNIPSLYASLIGAMLIGRVVWAAARVVLIGVAGLPFSFELFLAGAFVNALPGIVVQILLIPMIILALKNAGFKTKTDV